MESQEGSLAASVDATVFSVGPPRESVTLLRNDASDAWRDCSRGHGSELALVQLQSASQFESARNQGLARREAMLFATFSRGRVLLPLQLVMALSSAVSDV